MNADHRIRGLARPLLLALSLLALAIALIGPSETFAQGHKGTCSSSHAKARHAARTCPQASRKTKKTRPASKPRVVKRSHTKTRTKRGSHGSKATVFVPAVCENGSAPVLGAEGSFSCEDGSEPLCENGATPKRASNGKSLQCAVASEPEASGGETQCEEAETEEGTGCSVGAEAGEQACEAGLCEAES
jgi:hypothetical protein